MPFRKLYMRIWLAVVLAVAVLTLLVGWAWRMTAEPPLREVVVRNDAGEIIGNGLLRHSHNADNSAAAASEPAASDSSTPEALHGEARALLPHGKYGSGPEFIVRMVDGKIMHLHLPRPASANWRAPFGFFWTLGLVAVAVALAIYPIVRRLTHRLEALQGSMLRWGDGDLSVRVPQYGNDEVASVAAGFNHAAEQIETLMKAREALLASQKSLLANASHELRSPLTRIRMGLELLGDSAGTAAKEEISRNISELDQLIEEILLASRLDAKETDLGTVEAVDLVGLVAEECARTGATLDVEVSAMPVPGIAKLLRRVVRNLLENARRYAAGEVTLVLRSHNGRALLQVNDHGPGVPEALQERIFEPFYRLPGASERDGGVGLGLALVKSIVLRHGGQVHCRNREQGGATFEISLPLAD